MTSAEHATSPQTRLRCHKRTDVEQLGCGKVSVGKRAIDAAVCCAVPTGGRQRGDLELAAQRGAASTTSQAAERDGARATGSIIIESLQHIVSIVSGWGGELGTCSSKSSIQQASFPAAHVCFTQQLRPPG